MQQKFSSWKLPKRLRQALRMALHPRLISVYLHISYSRRPMDVCSITLENGESSTWIVTASCSWNLQERRMERTLWVIVVSDVVCVVVCEDVTSLAMFPLRLMLIVMWVEITSTTRQQASAAHIIFLMKAPLTYKLATFAFKVAVRSLLA